MALTELLESVLQHPSYRENRAWGKPRPGHPEGSIAAHIVELEANLQALAVPDGSEESCKLKLLIHVHDTFKKDSKKGVAIADPRSHASLARAFLAELGGEPDLLAMVWMHDEPYALYRQEQTRGSANPERVRALLESITDWELFLKFVVIDGSTEGKSREPLHWALQHLGSPKGMTEKMKGWMETLGSLAVS